jgi:hypothetical protein
MEKLKHHNSLNLKLSLKRDFYIGNGLFLLFSRILSPFFSVFRVVIGALNHPPVFMFGACGMLSSSNITGGFITKSFFEAFFGCSDDSAELFRRTGKFLIVLLSAFSAFELSSCYVNIFEVFSKLRLDFRFEITKLFLKLVFLSMTGPFYPEEFLSFDFSFSSPLLCT